MTTLAVPLVALVPAAGASRRFGAVKLLHELGGVPLLERTLRCVLDAGVDRVILVTSPASSFATVPGVTDSRVVTVVNPDPERGMFSSIRIGLAQLAPGETVLVLPADMPFVEPATVARLVSAHRASEEPVVAAYRGRRGHPLIVPSRVWRAVLEMDGTPGLKAALLELGVEPRQVDVNDPGVVRDVDVPADLDWPEPLE